MYQWILRVLLSTTLLGCSPSLAADGAVYRCTVRDFIGTGKDEAFAEANRAKTFDIFDLGKTLRVMAQAPAYEPSSTDYVIERRRPTGTIATAHGIVGANTLAIQADAAQLASSPIEASVVIQGPFFANIWLLQCAKLR